MKKRAEHNAPTWPDALSHACPACNHAFPLAGVRPDGGLLFRCFTHGWLSADSRSSPTAIVDTHHNRHRALDAAARREFVTGALSILVRAGAAADDLILQSITPDNSMYFGLVDDGVGGVVTLASARQNDCPVCETRPLAPDREEVLFNLGFREPAEGENYRAAAWSWLSPAALAAMGAKESV